MTIRQSSIKSLIEDGNPKLKQFPVKDGKVLSLTLEYNLGYNHATGKTCRKRESLKLTLVANPRDPMQRQQNRDTVELARRIRWEREQEFLQNREGYRLRKDRKVNFLDYCQQYIDTYTKKDVRMITLARNRFSDFLTAQNMLDPKHLTAEEITPDLIRRFVDYLHTRSKGEGAKTIYKRFKKIVKNCMEAGYMKSDPCKGITCAADEDVLTKDWLTMDEVQKLIATHYPQENVMVRNAFIFCLYTGVRWCDVKDLTFANIDVSAKMLRFEQVKTKGHSSKSWVYIPLTDGLLNLVGQPPKGQGKDARIFRLPTYESSCKSVKYWVKKAGIDKHISWHSARHSFAVNILNNGANIKTVSSLLGHSSLRHTEKYTRVVDKLKEDAINSLPELKL